MGRPLNKKYFGNRNIGSSSTSADNKIGGEGIASINWSSVGSWLSTAGGSNAPLAGLALPAPTLPGGVQATWTNYFGARQVTTGAGSVGLVVGETYEYAPIPGLLVTVATSGNNGTNATFTVTNAGSTTTLLTDLQGVNLTLKTGSGAATFLVDIYMKVVNTVINEKGSGYIGTETFTVTTANSAVGTAPAGTIVLTTDSGAAGSATNQENAIKVYAKTTSGGTRKIGDIIKQVNDTTYKVKTADGTLQKCVLRTDGGNGVGTCDITAYDSAGGEYWVKKLTSRKAVLVVKGTNGGSQFATGKAAKWTFGDAVANTTVKIDNA